MPRFRERVPVRLDTGNVESLTAGEVAAILRAVDPIVARGGRTLAAQILKGSRVAKVLELGLDRIPPYGFYRLLTLPEITARIDWMIKRKYLAIDYPGDLPLLVFTDRGWAIEIETLAEEHLLGFDARLAKGAPYEMVDFKDRKRDLIMLLIEKIERSGRRELIPLLEEWRDIEYKKVRARINGVIERLGRGPGRVLVFPVVK